MKVKYFGYANGLGMGNLMWDGKFPMMAGKFPPNHPVGGGWVAGQGDQYGSGESIDVFRGRGYWASCFPEGDGVCFKPLNAQATETIQQDVRECFGWDLEVVRP